MTTRTLRIGGRAVRVATSALESGSVPVLLFNGIGANLEICRPLVEELAARGVGCVVFDAPGAGESETPVFPYRLADVARLAARVLDRLEVAGPVDVAGVSWGGALAQQFAYQFSKRTRKLVLCATSAGMFAVPASWTTIVRLLDARRYADAAYMQAIGGELYGGLLRLNPLALASHAVSLKAPTNVGYLYQLAAAFGWSSAAWLHRITAPTLVIMGTDDPIMPVANGKIIASLIPGARLFTIDDGHLFFVSRAADVADLVATFLSKPERQPHAGAKKMHAA